MSDRRHIGGPLVSLVATLFDGWPRARASWQRLGETVTEVELIGCIRQMDPFEVLYPGWDPYLARNLTKEEQYTCFFYHYLHLSETLRPDAVHGLFFDNTVLWRLPEGDRKYYVDIQLSHSTPHKNPQQEGDLALQFRLDDAILYTLSFNIVPGYIIGVAEPHTLLLCRMQGRPGAASAIRTATKELRETSPQTVLVSVLRGIAAAMGSCTFAASCASNQPSCKPENAGRIETIYDDFFVSLGAEGPHNGFFLIDTQPKERPLKSGHRLRKNAKRRFKAEIAASSCRAWRAIMAEDGGASAATEEMASKGVAWFRAGARDLSAYFVGEHQLRTKTAEAAALQHKLKVARRRLGAAQDQIKMAQDQIADWRTADENAQMEIAILRKIVRSVVTTGRRCAEGTAAQSAYMPPERRFGGRLRALLATVMRRRFVGDARRLLALADEARDAGHWRGAARYYQGALRRHPRAAPIWVQFGHALKESGQAAEAERAYRTALLCDPMNGDTYGQLGHVLKMLGRRGESEAAYLQALLANGSLRWPEYELAALGWSPQQLACLRQLAGSLPEGSESTAARLTEGKGRVGPQRDGLATEELSDSRGLPAQSGLEIRPHRQIAVEQASAAGLR